MQQKDNRICVIARYKENLDWVNKLDSSIVIYNKSDTFEYNFPKHDVSNYGRETESFIRFIIQYYNQLDAFDSVIFLQGNPFEHCNSILELIKNTDHKTFAYLSDRNANASFPDSDYFKMHLSTMCRLFNIEHDWDIKSFANSNNESNSLLSSIRHLENCIALSYFLGINTKGKSYEWATGCQYQVPVFMIKNKSLQWWLDIHNVHTFFSSTKKNDFISYVLETLWPLLILHNSAEGD
jgi:hypothetical protein